MTVEHIMNLADTLRWETFFHAESKPSEVDSARAALLAAVEELAKDAARYRWLRNNCLNAGHGSVTVFLDDRGGSGNFHKQIYKEQIDSAIDQSMKDQS